ncbi:MAG: DUF2460 domain-containing protein [Pseudomonadota bacterium]|nr:DUF2460 domain-containing protein [Pseudomonadota bacterium]
MAFHEVRFPTAISRGASGGPERRTEIVTLGSGYEERNQRWADSRRRYDAGWGVKTLDQLHAVVGFFEERRGMLHGFRWKDHADFKSCQPLGVPTMLDQALGTGDGVDATFQLVKRYGGSFAPWSRTIAKPVQGSVRVAVAGSARTEGTHFTVDYATGVITFTGGNIPTLGQAVTAGFEFDVPARFDTDRLVVNLDQFQAGSIPNIPILEIRV